MKPFFPFFGSKYRIAKRYGAPRHPAVVEPFAGSATYSVYWEPKHVLLMDRDIFIVEAWRWLISASPAEVMALPIEFETTDDLDLPAGAKYVIGFWLNKGGSHPNKKPGKWWAKYRHDGQCRVWSESARARIAGQVDKIRHWQIEQADFRQSPEEVAHWFIDPPYIVAGHKYRGPANDYAAIAEFCRSRQGFVQVCENEGADWLPFKRFHAVRGMIKPSVEALYEQDSL